MKCLIIDDEETSQLILSQHCSGIKDLELVEIFSNAMEAIKYLNKNEVDLIFLDIHMDGFSGFDLIQTLKTPPRVILTTSDRTLALDAFEYSCIADYVVKPIDFERFKKAVEKAKNFSLKKPSLVTEQKSIEVNSKKEFYINIDRTLIKIETATVKIIEAQGDYILIQTNGKTHKVRSTIKKILQKLPPDTFFHVHRSYVINLSKIIDIQDNSILIDRDVIPISRSKRPELMRLLNLL